MAIIYDNYQRTTFSAYDWAPFKTLWENASNTTITLNGSFTPTLPDINTIEVGDVVQVVQEDVTVYEDILDYATLRSFYSTLNAVNKYIITLSDIANSYFYVDDAQIYLVGDFPSSLDPSLIIRRGRLIPRLNDSVVRHLTHRDLSLNATSVSAMLTQWQNQEGPAIPGSLKIYVRYRKTQRDYFEILDTHRIRDLDRLPSEYRLQALTGITSNVPVWRAEELEGCPYNIWRGMEASRIPTASLENVYSRYGAIDALERLHRLGDNGDKWLLPPIVANYGGRVVTFNNGKRPLVNQMLPRVPVGNYANVRWPNATGLELFLPDLGHNGPIDRYFAAGTFNNPSIHGGFDTLVYFDLGDDNLVVAEYDVDYSINGNMLIWLGNSTSKDRYVRQANVREEWVRTEISAQDFVDGIPLYLPGDTRVVHDVGMGCRFFWLNGMFLAEGIDYFIHSATGDRGDKDARLYLSHVPDTLNLLHNQLECLAAGVPDKTLRHVNRTKWGFIKNGKVSFDSRYDVYADRNNWVSMGGYMVHGYKYGHEFFNTDPPDPLPENVEGRPYAIVPLPVFTRRELLDPICPSLEDDKALDVIISDYLTTLLPEPDLEESVVSDVYDLFSPFMNAIIDGVAGGFIPVVYSNMTQEYVEGLVANYLWLLPYDPCLWTVDTAWVDIHPRLSPTPVSLTSLQYDFIQKVNEYWLNSRILSFANHITLTP